MNIRKRRILILYSFINWIEFLVMSYKVQRTENFWHIQCTWEDWECGLINIIIKRYYQLNLISIKNHEHIKRQGKGWHFILIKGLIHQKEITIINLCALNVSASNFIKHILKNLKAHLTSTQWWWEILIPSYQQ
jgi:hypothetical protein